MNIVASLPLACVSIRQNRACPRTNKVPPQIFVIQNRFQAFKIPQVNYTFKWICVCCFVVLALGANSTLGMRVGPRFDHPEVFASEALHGKHEVRRARLDIPSFRLAITVLNPNIPTSTLEQENQGIWPEVRKLEAVRIAFKLKYSVARINQFDSIVVTEDVTASADFFLVCDIERSTSEIMSLACRMIDATGLNWFPKRYPRYVWSHQAEIGWHSRYQDTDYDPFDPLYEKVADAVYEQLSKKFSVHVRQQMRNDRVGSKRARRTDLELITLTRDLAFARFIAPDEYYDTLNEDGHRLKLEYVPENWSANWNRISSLMTREEDFVDVMEAHFESFVEENEPEYKKWQKEAFPVANKLRLAWNKQEAITEINLLGNKLHHLIKPTRIHLSGRVITLSGSVHKQFGEWRSILADLYQESEDLEAITILDEDN